jgi:hypothetical protein
LTNDKKPVNDDTFSEKVDINMMGVNVNTDIKDDGENVNFNMNVGGINTGVKVTTTTQTQSCVTAGCGAYTAWSPACGSPGTQQTRSASCINDQGVGYTDTQTQCCTGVVVSTGPCTGGIRKFASVSTTTYFANCTSSTVTRNEECLAFL